MELQAGVYPASQREGDSSVPDVSVGIPGRSTRSVGNELISKSMAWSLQPVTWSAPVGGAHGMFLGPRGSQAMVLHPKE